MEITGRREYDGTAFKGRCVMTNRIRCLLLIVASLIGTSGTSQTTQRPKLWAVIGVSESLLYEDSNGSTHSLNVSFGLVNDGHAVANTDAGSWRILIDGQEVPDSDSIFGNGPGPIGGWGTLPPGESFIFGKALPMGKYFNKPGIYEVTWKGSQFSARPVIVRVLPPPGVQ